MLKKLETMQQNINYFVGFCGHNKNLTKEQFYKLDQVKEILKDFSNIRKILKEIYLEYTNEYLTLDFMAEKECISEEDLKMLIDLGKKINEKEY